MSDIYIRKALPGDAALISSVMLASFMEYVSLYTPEAFAATTPTGDQIRGRMGEGPAWVAVANHAIVGTVAAVGNGEGLYIRGMAVRPIARGKGIGELLMERVERFALENGHRRMWLSTTPFLDRAIRLYERLGFRRSDEGPKELYGTPLFTMVKELEG